LDRDCSDHQTAPGFFFLGPRSSPESSSQADLFALCLVPGVGFLFVFSRSLAVFSSPDIPAYDGFCRGCIPGRPGVQGTLLFSERLHYPHCSPHKGVAGSADPLLGGYFPKEKCSEDFLLGFGFSKGFSFPPRVFSEIPPPAGAGPSAGTFFPSLPFSPRVFSR